MKIYAIAVCLVFGWAPADSLNAQVATPSQPSAGLNKGADSIRFASFNISFNRKKEGQLRQELTQNNSINPKRIAEIIQRVRPDVILICEFDFDAGGEGVESFCNNYLGVSQNGQTPIQFEHVFIDSVNTGVDSGQDLNRDGKLATANDAFGFGVFPGQYGMAVLSKYEIDKTNIRTFRTFLWKDMPDGLWPVEPNTKKPYYNDDIKSVFRLSSKSHWDVPIVVGDKTIHFLAAHPTPPVFDGDEDRNGKRNHDEIRFLADYVTPGKSGYIYDDHGKKGGLSAGAKFVIAGDMNADPNDGDSTMNAARLLTEHGLINHSKTPASKGGGFFSKQQGRTNLRHSGNPDWDTGDFNDGSVGNLRIDYCLPSKTLEISKCGVFWPVPGQPGAELVTASDHRLVWVDILK